ncbi:MAG TPA: hypothetical protein PKW50_04315 [Syntrophomonas sp.]|nr:hypothetical protein [Syntrophomonas sp.]
MNEYDIKRLAMILAEQADVEGMKAANMQRKHCDESMAYNDADFSDKADSLRQLASISNDNLERLIHGQ